MERSRQDYARYIPSSLMYCGKLLKHICRICESNDDNRTTPIQINDVTPDVFRHLLFYMYGG
jgi:hypothetical protein